LKNAVSNRHLLPQAACSHWNWFVQYYHVVSVCNTSNLFSYKKLYSQNSPLRKYSKESNSG
jgi:hypothetical protein